MVRTIGAFCVIGVFLFLYPVGTNAQDKKVDSIKTSVYSNIDFAATNTGIFGYNPVTHKPQFSAPRNSGKSYLFGSGIWFGATKIVNGSPRPLVFYTYNPFSSNGEAAPGELTPDSDEAPPSIYHSVQYDKTDGTRLGIPPDSAARWPLWNLPGTLPPVPLNPGRFEPRQSARVIGMDYDSPAFLTGVDEQFMARFHDGNLNRYEISMTEAKERGYPIGLQFQENIFAWGREGLRDIIIIQYQIINRSADTLIQCVAAQMSDPDIGSADTNDHATFYSGNGSLRAAYAWSDLESSGSCGALAMILVEAPMTTRGWVDNTRRKEYETAGRAGSFVTWKRKSSPNYPVTDIDRYSVMLSGRMAVDSGAGDQRVLLASQPFDMKPGDTAYFAVAYAILDTIPTLTGGGSYTELAKATVEPQLAQLVETIRTNYYYTGPLPTSAPGVADGSVATEHPTVSPNPAHGTATIHFSLQTPSAVDILLLNTLGQVVRAEDLGTLAIGGHEYPIDLSELPSGSYIAIIETSNGRETVKLAVAP